MLYQGLRATETKGPFPHPVLYILGYLPTCALLIGTSRAKKSFHDLPPARSRPDSSEGKKRRDTRSRNMQKTAKLEGNVAMSSKITSKRIVQ